jgi:hypothetical protein
MGKGLVYKEEVYQIIGAVCGGLKTSATDIIKGYLPDQPFGQEAAVPPNSGTSIITPHFPGKVRGHMEYRELTENIIGCAYRVYNRMGFGFLESVYEKCMLIIK